MKRYAAVQGQDTGSPCVRSAPLGMDQQDKCRAWQVGVRPFLVVSSLVPEFLRQFAEQRWDHLLDPRRPRIVPHAT